MKTKRPLLKRFKDALGDKVESVRKSTRLTDSPACLVLGEHDMGVQMRRINGGDRTGSPGEQARIWR